MGKGGEQIIYKSGCQKCQDTHENMLNVTKNQGNVN